MNPTLYNTYTNKEFCRLFLHEATTPLEKALLHRLENYEEIEQLYTEEEYCDQLEKETKDYKEQIEDIDSGLQQIIDKYENIDEERE